MILGLFYKKNRLRSHLLFAVGTLTKFGDFPNLKGNQVGRDNSEQDSKIQLIKFKHKNNNFLVNMIYNKDEVPVMVLNFTII